MASFLPPRRWTRIPIASLEDLRDAVYGAGLEATQMSSAALSGSLAFSHCDHVLFCSGLIDGQVALTGPLSTHLLTIGVGLRMGAGTRHWLQETASGAVGVFHGGDEHDALYTNGSLYATATLSIDRLEEVAADEDVVLDLPMLGGTGLHEAPLSQPVTDRLAEAFDSIHSAPPGQCPDIQAGHALLRALVHHIGRVPAPYNRMGTQDAHERIVRKARDYIMMHLAAPISPDGLARATGTSRRSLFRAFAAVLGDTPQAYIRRLRLHRIRQALASEEERDCTIALISNEWGIGELGRMSGWYRDLFGESPSTTRANRLRRQPDLPDWHDLHSATVKDQ